jgi:uncharacterized Zn-binding protein involved in type VI secretion
VAVSFAAVSGSFAVCPLCDGPKPHVGGVVVVAGKRTVRIGGMFAAVKGDRCVCAGPPTNTIDGASRTVKIDGAFAARMGDATTHKGAVLVGWPTVLIG